MPTISIFSFSLLNIFWSVDFRQTGRDGGRCPSGENDVDGEVCGEQVRRRVHHDFR